MSFRRLQYTPTPRATAAMCGWLPRGRGGAGRFFGLIVAALWLGGGCERPPEPASPEPAAPTASALASGPVQTQPAPQLNLVIITLDTTRADHLGCYGYFRDTSPHLDAFAAEALLFENAYAPMATTLPTHVSLFTGLHPLEHGVLANVSHGGSPFGMKKAVVPAARLAREAGYATAAFVSATPVKKHSGIADGFETFNEPRKLTRKARPTTDLALKWLDAHRDRQFLLWVHYFDPHARYQPPAPFNSMFRVDAQSEQWIRERNMPEQIVEEWRANRHSGVTRELIDLYDGEIRYMDEHLGRLLRRLREGGLWESTAVLILTDHGEGLNQHAWPQHGGTWSEQLHVAVLMRVPGSGGTAQGRVPTLMTTADVLPTLLPLMRADWGEPLLKQASGVNVLAPRFRGRPVLSLRTGREDNPNPGPDMVLRSAEWALHVNDPAAGTLLFDRQNDPFELDNRAAAKPDTVERLTEQMHALAQHFRDRGVELDAGGKAEDSAPLDEKTLRELKALGYIAGDEGESEDEDP